MGSPSRRSSRASRSQGSVWRRFSVSSIGGRRWTSGGEEAAGFDLGELVVVADEDELDLEGLGVVEELGEVAGADHGGFVDHEDRWIWRDGRESAFEGEVAGARAMVVEGMPEPASSSAAARAARAQPRTRMPLASQASRAASKRVGLAGARAADDDLDAGARLG